MPCQAQNKILKTQAKTIKVFVFLVCVFGFWFLSFDFVQAGWTSGKFGSAINFDGINDYVNSNSNLAAASAFSYSLWFKSSDGAFAADEYLFSQGTNDPSVYLESTDNKLKVMADGADKLSSVKTVNNTQWRHLEITADGTTIKLYLDGILESSAGYTGSSAAGILYVASSAAPGSYFGGIIDDVKIYSYARTSDEVLTDYNSGKAAHLGKDSQRDDGLVGFWNMEEGKGQTVYDRSGNGNSGTLGASTAVAKDDPVFTSGYSSAGAGGTALKFDGVNDYVDAGKASSINSLTNFTYIAWIYGLDYTQGYNSIVAQSAYWRKGFIVYGAGDNRLRAVVYSSTTAAQAQSATNTIMPNQWYFVAMVYNDTTKVITLYINGVEPSYAGSTTGVGTITHYPTFNYLIGSDSVAGRYFNGTIDEVRIYNRALSADEIRQHYNQKKPILELKMDEGSGTTTKDESFNNNDAAFPAADANKPTWSNP